jgi:hypothetical protein
MIDMTSRALHSSYQDRAAFSTYDEKTLSEILGGAVASGRDAVL